MVNVFWDFHVEAVHSRKIAVWHGGQSPRAVFCFIQDIDRHGAEGGFRIRFPMSIQRSRCPSPRSSSFMIPNQLHLLLRCNDSISTPIPQTRKPRNHLAAGSHHRAAYHIDPRPSPARTVSEQPDARLYFRDDPCRVRVVGALEIAPGTRVGLCPLAGRRGTAGPSVLEGGAVAEVFAVGARGLDAHPCVVAGAGFEVRGRAHGGKGEVTWATVLLWGRLEWMRKKRRGVDESRGWKEGARRGEWAAPCGKVRLCLGNRRWKRRPRKVLERVGWRFVV